MHDSNVVNICFHGIGTPRRELEPGEGHYWIASDQFHRILDEIATWPNTKISFDDGNSSDIDEGLDALAHRELDATFFVLAGRFGKAGSLSEIDVKELRRRGMRIGTHGMYHRPWPGMPKPLREAEFVEARARIAAAAGCAIDEAAAPLGRYDRKVLRELRTLRYTTVHTSDRRVARSGSWLQPRFSVTKSDTPASLRAEVAAANSAIQKAVLSTKGFAKRLR